MRAVRAKPAADDDRTEAHEQPGTVLGREGAHAGREDEHDRRDRQQRGAGLQGAVAEDDLELEGEEEDGTAEGTVEDEGDDVGGNELPRGEELVRQQRWERRPSKSAKATSKIPRQGGRAAPRRC